MRFPFFKFLVLATLLSTFASGPRANNLGLRFVHKEMSQLERVPLRHAQIDIPAHRRGPAYKLDFYLDDAGQIRRLDYQELALGKLKYRMTRVRHFFDARGSLISLMAEDIFELLQVPQKAKKQRVDFKRRSARGFFRQGKRIAWLGDPMNKIGLYKHNLKYAGLKGFWKIFFNNLQKSHLRTGASQDHTRKILALVQALDRKDYRQFIQGEVIFRLKEKSESCVNYPRVPLRLGPSSRDPAVLNLDIYQNLQILTRGAREKIRNWGEDHWYRVRLEDRLGKVYTGWVFGVFLDRAPIKLNQKKE